MFFVSSLPKLIILGWLYSVDFLRNVLTHSRICFRQSLVVRSSEQIGGDDRLVSTVLTKVSAKEKYFFKKKLQTKPEVYCFHH